MTPSDSPHQPSGLPAALGAYLLWGFLPLYLITVRSVPPVEFVGWRIIWTLPVCIVIVLLRRQLRELAAALKDRKALLILTTSATLIGINWFVYVWAVQSGHIYAASLGYYINPLINILLGTLLLGERLSRPQWIAVGLAGCGVAVLLAGALTTLWISLTLALSFGAYALLRKQVSVGSLPGLTIESALLLPVAASIAAWYAAQPQGSAFLVSPGLSALIALGGVFTAIPLLLFAVGARRLDLSTLGFVQYLTPTMVFVLGLTVFGEEMKPAQAVSFTLIWSAIAVFVWDAMKRRRPSPAA